MEPARRKILCFKAIVFPKPADFMLLKVLVFNSITCNSLEDFNYLLLVCLTTHVHFIIICCLVVKILQ